MAPGACWEHTSSGLTGRPASILNYHSVSAWKSRHHCATLCLGENPAQAKLKCLDLRCSFEVIVKAEYGGRDHPDFAVRNYTENVKKEETGIAGITYERALCNLIVAMYGHYVDLFLCHSSTASHQIVLAYNCLEVAAKLGRYHWAVRRLQPGEDLPDWIPTPEVPAGDIRRSYVDAFTLLGDVMHLAFGHPKALARAFDHVYYEGQEIGNLPLGGRKTAEQSEVVYRAEYAQILHHFSTLAPIDCEKFVQPMPTSLVRLEMVYPDKKYEAYCLKTPESGPVAWYEPVSGYKMDGLQPRVDLRPDAEVPSYPEDEVDADPRFNEYPPEEEFVEGPDWEPGRIPPKIRSPEYTGSSSDSSMDTQAARAMQAVSVSADTEPPVGTAGSVSGGGDTRKVELAPLLGLTEQFVLHMEREIQKQIEEHSRKLVQDVLKRSTSRVMPPVVSEAAWASLSQCFQKVMATYWAKPPEQPEAKPKEAPAPAQYSRADPFAGINPPPPDILQGSRSEQPSRGRMTQHSEQPRLDYPAEEKKRRSTSCKRGEAEPKRGRSTGTEPSWDTSNIGARQPDKAQSQPTDGSDVPEPKVKSIVKKVCISMPELEDLGPAAQSRYDDSSRDDRHWHDWSHHRDSSVRPKDTRHGKSGSGATGKAPRRSESGSGKSDPKSKPMAKAWALNWQPRKNTRSITRR